MVIDIDFILKIFIMWLVCKVVVIKSWCNLFIIISMFECTYLHINYTFLTTKSMLSVIMDWLIVWLIMYNSNPNNLVLAKEEPIVWLLSYQFEIGTLQNMDWMDNGHATNPLCKMCEVHFKASNDNKYSIPCSLTQQRLWVFENYIPI